jgi:hypothetical protein
MSAMRAESAIDFVGVCHERTLDDDAPAVLKSYFLDPVLSLPTRVAWRVVAPPSRRRQDFDPARIIRRACSTGLRPR